MIPRFRVRGAKEFVDFIGEYARVFRGIITEAVADYLIGDEVTPGTYYHGLGHYPPYKYVSRKSAYGKTFQSDKQRRYIMARIREGSIEPGYPHRFGTIQRGWQKGGTGAKAYIFNQAKGVEFVHGDDTQARQPAAVGWRRVSIIIKTNLVGAMSWADKKLKQYQESRQK